MPLDEFWYGDLRLLNAYHKAYYRNVEYNAWKIGNYALIATYKGTRNAIATKKSEMNWNWVDFNDPVKKLEKSKPISKENMEVEFRKRQAQDKAFVRKILHRS